MNWLLIAVVYTVTGENVPHEVRVNETPFPTEALCEAARSLMEEGATAVHAAITHPVLSGPALKRIAESPLEQVIVTDTIPLRPDAVDIGKLHVVSVAAPIGEAIRRINNEESVSSLF